jgi:hypothetical protein
VSAVRIAVAIATAGRRDFVTGVVTRIAAQTRAPDFIAVCPARPEDIDRPALAAMGVRFAEGPIGLCAQRNALLRHLVDADIVLFLDDDFVTAPEYVERCVALFQQHPDVVMATGAVIADGILGPGLTFAEADTLVDADRPPPDADRLEEVYNGYGCNMAIRMAPVRAAGLLFDENLPFYGWLEDVDFSRRLAEHGRIVRTEACRGVHMGVKRGRSPGTRLGYSQIANPVYMWRKGTLTASRACAQMVRNLAANLSKSLKPEPWVDRGGRTRGNLLALSDLLRGRIAPQRAAELN